MREHKQKPKENGREADILDYQADLRIDPLALDEEFEEQPRKFMRYAKAASDARRRKDLANQAMMLARAKLRSQMMKVNGNRVTEGMLEERLLQTEEWREYKRWSYRHEVLEEAKQAFWQRKNAIEGLIELFRMEYCAKPRMPRDLTAYSKAQRMAVQKGISEKLNKN